MAKKTKSEAVGQGLAITLVIIVAIILICLAIYPIVLILGLILCNLAFLAWKASEKKRARPFWLDAEEVQEFKDKIRVYSHHHNLITAAEAKAEEAGVSRNADGAISNRSKLGKELRQIIETNFPAREELKPRLLELQEKPKSDWETFILWGGLARAFSMSSFVWL